MEEDKESQKLTKRIRSFLSENRGIRTAIIAAIVLITLNIASIKYIEWDSGLSQNLFATMLGSFLDVVLFGILIVLINLRMEKKRDIKRWQEEIDDYKYWKEKEATYRIIGIIKRLNRRGVTNMDLSYCFLDDAILGVDPQSRVDYTEGILSLDDLMRRKKGYLVIIKGAKEKNIPINLQGAIMIKTQLNRAMLIDVNMINANLYRAELRSSYLLYANLSDTNLRKTNFTGAFLGGTHFHRATMIGTILRDAKGLSIDQLSNAKTLYEAELDPQIEKAVREKYPHLLEKPKDEAEGQEGPDSAGR